MRRDRTFEKQIIKSIATVVVMLVVVALLVCAVLSWTNQ